MLAYLKNTSYLCIVKLIEEVATRREKAKPKMNEQVKIPNETQPKKERSSLYLAFI